MVDNRRSRSDPTQGFLFRVSFAPGFGNPPGPGEYVGFKKVSGLGAAIERLEWQECTDYGPSLQFPAKLRYSEVTLERGVDLNDTMWRWFCEVKDVTKNFTWRPLLTFRKDVTITLYDRRSLASGLAEARWTLKEAWPTAYDWGDLDAMSSEVLLATVKLAHEGIQFDTQTPGNWRGRG